MKIKPGASLYQERPRSQTVADEALNIAVTPVHRLQGRFRGNRRDSGRKQRHDDPLDEAIRKQSGDGGFPIASTMSHRKMKRVDILHEDVNLGSKRKSFGTPLGSPPGDSSRNQSHEKPRRSPFVCRGAVVHDVDDDLSFGTQDENDVNYHGSTTKKTKINLKKYTPSPADSDMIHIDESDAENHAEESDYMGEASARKIVRGLGRTYRDSRASPSTSLSFSKVNNHPHPSPHLRNKSSTRLMDNDEIESVSSLESLVGRKKGRRERTKRSRQDSFDDDYDQKLPRKKQSPKNQILRTLTYVMDKSKKAAKTTIQYLSPSYQKSCVAQRTRSADRKPSKHADPSNDVIELSSDEESVILDDGEQLVDDSNLNLVSESSTKSTERPTGGTLDETGTTSKIVEGNPLSPRQSSRLSQPVGQRVRCDALRIAIGSKVFDKGCVLQFQPSSRRPKLRIDYENTASSEIRSHETYLDEEEIKELYYYVPENASQEKKRIHDDSANATTDSPCNNDRTDVHNLEAQHKEEKLTTDLNPVENIDNMDLVVNNKESSKEGVTSEGGESSKESPKNKSAANEACSQPCYLVMRIRPTDHNKLSLYPNKYLTNDCYPPKHRAPRSTLMKRFVIAEISDRVAFKNLLEFMKKNEMLHSLILGGELTFKKLHEKITSLLPNPVSVSLKTSLDSKFKHDETILVFPFQAKDHELSKAANGLTEAGGKLVSSDSSAFFSDQTDDSIVARSDNQPATKVHTVTIRGEDYDRLKPCEFLNDTLIDFWISWLVRRMGAAANEVHVFTTQFYTKLEDEGVEAVSSWTAKKKLDIFEKKFIIIPVNKNIHWSLFVVVNPGKAENGHDSFVENDDEVLEHPFCLFMDSLRVHKKVKMWKVIQQWLNAEAKRLGKFQRLGKIEPFNTQSLPIVDPKVPRQDNSWDCGVFVCRYAFNILRLLRMPFAHKHSEWTDADKRRNQVTKWITESPEFQFNMNDISRLRIEMACLIKELSSIYSSKLEVKNRQKKLLEKKQNTEIEKFQGPSTMEV